jgi:hypothetical protein
MANKVIGVSVGADGAVWCADSLGNLYMRVSSEWKRNPTAIATEVAVGNANEVWCRNAEGSIYKLQGATYNAAWGKDPLASQVKRSIAAGGDGVVWVVNNSDQLFKLEGGQWKQNPTGKAVEVSVGDANNVWCRNSGGQIFRLASAGYANPWIPETVPGLPVISIGAGNDGAVWVANEKGELFAKDGPTWRMNEHGKARQISVGNKNLVWCVNEEGKIFHAESNDWRTYWKEVGQPLLPQPVLYEIKENDTLLSIIRVKFDPKNAGELAKKADQIAKLNKWTGTLGNDYNGRARNLKPGEVIILEA